MFFGWKKRCRHLEAENAQLKAHSAQLEARLTESQAKNQQLLQALAAARKNSRNSSKRPSSDIVKPPPRPLGKGKRRNIGAQPGHPKHEHPAFTPAQIDHHISYELEHCPADPSHRLVALADQQNAEETGHKENGRRYWTWCFRAKAFIVFKIHASRGSDVLFDSLGQNFQGRLGADFWGAYRKYAGQCGVLIQFCLAHLIREVKYLCEFPDPSVQRYGQALLAGLKELFDALHRRAELSSKAFALVLATG
jgi:hypothetical protein